ncbi:hypothetical protein [Vibrio vulnificus]|uniref:hypothetical protein n=1 Tax=Vibrio vulnificus TaxID=672 RepID=UPI000D734527|nr:hypothetical protein [Vibrio vulnificus]PWY29195.1 hypothetical protein VV86_23350 [Vibrio vulnificus]
MSNKLKYDKYDNCDIYDDNYDNSTLNKRAIMKAIKNIVVLERLKQREIAELLDIKQAYRASTSLTDPASISLAG